MHRCAVGFFFFFIYEFWELFTLNFLGKNTKSCVFSQKTCSSHLLVLKECFLNSDLNSQRSSCLARFSLPVSLMQVEAVSCTPGIDCCGDNGCEATWADSIQSKTENHTDCDSVLSSDLSGKLFNGTLLASCCFRISLNKEMFCTALTFNLCSHLRWSIGCQICWYHRFLCHMQTCVVFGHPTEKGSFSTHLPVLLCAAPSSAFIV